MKNILTVLLSGLVLCGCSDKQAASDSRAIDLVVAGKDVAWGRGAVLHIAKRDGSSVEGVRLLLPRADGKKGMHLACPMRAFSQ